MRAAQYDTEITLPESSMDFFVCGGGNFLGCGGDDANFVVCGDQQLVCDDFIVEDDSGLVKDRDLRREEATTSPSGVEADVSGGGRGSLSSDLPLAHAHPPPLDAHGVAVDLSAARGSARGDSLARALMPSDTTAQLVREYELGGARASAQWGPPSEEGNSAYAGLLQRTFVTDAPWQALYDLMPLRADEAVLFEEHLGREMIWARMVDTERGATLLWRAAQLGDGLAVDIMLRKRLGDLASLRDTSGLDAVAVAKLEGHHNIAKRLAPHVAASRAAARAAARATSKAGGGQPDPGKPPLRRARSTSITGKAISIFTKIPSVRTLLRSKSARRDSSGANTPPTPPTPRRRSEAPGARPPPSPKSPKSPMRLPTKDPPHSPMRRVPKPEPRRTSKSSY